MPQLSIAGSTNADARYVSWAPVPCELRLDAPAASATSLRITNKTKTGGGKLSFFTAANAPPATSLTLTVPAGSASATFWVGGRFQSPSSEDRDTSIVVSNGATTLLEVPLMVRVRKDAQTLSDAERDRFVAAFAQLNAQGTGPFQRFRDMHVDASVEEAHFNMGFLPWHRAYLLDLERELQAIDPSVALPYWRFDEPAPRLFHRDFIGASDGSGTVQFAASNPLQFWVTDGVPGVVRSPLFDTRNEGANDANGSVLSESEALNLGRQLNSPYSAFVSPIEGDPHGHAHVTFGGSISQIPTAAKDPLFFLLHANVDRLWAKWQWTFGRLDAANTTHYRPGNRVGHRPNDTMWPWNGVTTPPRPDTAPGGTIAGSPMTSAPAASPAVREMLDWQGRLAPAGRLAFDYDDVPFG